jgi:hypothetical protein
MAELLLRGNRRSAENHYRAQQTQHQRHSKQPTVGF